MMTENSRTARKGPPFTASIETVSDHAARVRVRGELDIATAVVFREVLFSILDTRRPTIVIDASQLRFCDSQGLSALVAAGNRAQALGGGITVVHPQPVVGKVLRVTGLDRRFTAVPAVAGSHRPPGPRPKPTRTRSGSRPVNGSAATASDPGVAG
jgi:anti-anti-sigma factor